MAIDRLDDPRQVLIIENTLDREIGGKSSAAYLWEEKHVVPFLKVDKGLAEESNGVQLMKPMPDLDALLERLAAAGIDAETRPEEWDTPETGRFARIHDPEGNPIELWQPAR